MKQDTAYRGYLIRQTLTRMRNNYLAAIEHTLLSVAVPSGQPDVSRVFNDIHSLVRHATAEIDSALTASEPKS